MVAGNGTTTFESDLKVVGNIFVPPSALAQSAKPSINLNLNNLEKAVIENLSQSEIDALLTADKIAGRVIFNTTSLQFGYWSGVSWIYFGTIFINNTVNDMFLSSNSITFTYNTTNKTMTADLKVANDLSVNSSGVQLSTTGVTVGTYTKVTVDSKGRVTSATNIAAGDLPSHNHVASQITDLAAVVKGYKLNEFNTPVADIPMGGTTLTGLREPTGTQDAATKNYVDNAVQGISPKDSVRVATTANITLSGTQTIDGVSVISGDSVLVKDQTTNTQNGIYVASGTAWSRRSDTDSWAELVSAYVWIDEGTAQASSGWLCTADAGGTLGTTALPWVQFSGAGQITAGDGLTKTGNTLNVVTPAKSGISVTADAIAIDTDYKVRNLRYTITGNGTLTTFAITGIDSTMDEAINTGGARNIEVYERTGTSAADYVWTRCFPCIRMKQSATLANVVYEIVFNIAPPNGKVYEVVALRNYK